MSDVLTLRIDGRDVAGSAGQTIMEVAEENGIDIPGLCHLTGIHDRGACRLCMVQIAGNPRLAAASDRGVPLVLSHPDTPAAEALARIARTIQGWMEAA